MRVMVSGATGFIGKALCVALAQKNQVYGLTRQTEAHLPSDIQAVLWDNSHEWHPEMPEVDVVIHLAAKVHLMDESAHNSLATFRASNVDMTSNLARWAALHKVKRFIYLSSIKVNGEATAADRAFTPDDKAEPEDAYAISKFEAEQALHQICADTGMELVVIRPPLVYGPGVSGNFRSLLQWVRRGIPLPLGSIDNRRSLIALDNLVDLISLCVTHTAAANQIFLAADGEDVSTTVLLHKLATAYDRPARLLPVPPGLLRGAAVLLGKQATADRLLGSLVVDASKTRDMLNWVPPVSMDAQLRKIALHDAQF